MGCDHYGYNDCQHWKAAHVCLCELAQSSTRMPTRCRRHPVARIVLKDAKDALGENQLQNDDEERHKLLPHLQECAKQDIQRIPKGMP